MGLVFIGMIAGALAFVCVAYVIFSVLEFILPELLELVAGILEAAWLGLVVIFRRIKSYF